MRGGTSNGEATHDPAAGPAPADPLPFGAPGEPTGSTGDTGAPLPGTWCGLPAAPDLDPDPEVVEVELRAAPLAWDPGTGTPVGDGLAFDGAVPGPVIVVDRGQRLRVRFANDTELPQGLHWHGMRVPEDQGGVHRIAHPVEPGGTFTYEFVVPDAGLYWYHPQVNTGHALERGLYGTIWVRDPAEPAVDCLSVVALDDLLVGEDGAVASAPTSPVEWASMERLGPTLLANGRTDTRTTVPPGASVVLAVVNVADARYFELSLEGHAVEVVGTDGGWLAAPHPLDGGLVIAPGERWFVHFVAGPEGEYPIRTTVVDLQNRLAPPDPLPRGLHTVWTLAVEGDPIPTTPLVLPAVEPRVADEVPVAHQILMDERRVIRGGDDWRDLPVVDACVGTVARYEVVNASPMRHPFHVQGQRLVVLDGSPLDALGWKDTFDIPVGETRTFETRNDNPGRWMYHCHHLEHVDPGLSGVFDIR